MKKKICMILCVLCGILLAGCSKEKEGIEMNVYYIDPDASALVQEVYYRADTDVENSIKEVMEVLHKPSNDKYQSAIPANVDVEGFRIENRRLELVFNNEYLTLNKSAEVLLRAAVVQTLVQIPDVSYVSFYVGIEQLKDSDGNAVGLMSADDFVQNTGSSLKSFQATDLQLYFPTKDGTKLSAEKRTNVHYNINTSIEKLVVEQLMKGTSSDKRSAAIPNAVKLLGVSTKDGICYVNFDSTFINEGFNLKPEVTIYSIVNSIVANGNVTKVQFLIDGSNEVKFMNTVDLSKPLEWKADLLEE